MFGNNSRYGGYRRLIALSMALVVLLAMGTGLAAAQATEEIGEAGDGETETNESVEESVETESEVAVDGPDVDIPEDDTDVSTDDLIDDVTEDGAVDDTISDAPFDDADDDTSVVEDSVPDEVSDGIDVPALL